MACTPDMLFPLKMPAPKGPVPSGLKVTALQDPNTLQMAPASPVLGVGGFTLWPMSYYDNRVSFGMVMYDLKWQPVAVVEKPGARYIVSITVNGTDENATVVFTGQANQTVTMSMMDLCNMLEDNPISMSA